jgi:hypothetical protein
LDFEISKIGKLFRLPAGKAGHQAKFKRQLANFA